MIYMTLTSVGQKYNQLLLPPLATYLHPHKTVIKKSGHPIKNSALYRDMRYLQKTIVSLSKKNFDSHRAKIYTLWVHTRNILLRIAVSFEYAIDLPPTDLTSTTLPQVKIHIKELYHLLVLEFKHQMKQYNEDQMKLFVKRREEDLTVNQKCMINSIVDHEMRTITIDRLVKEVDNDKVLVTDPQEIKIMTNDHFQKCPGAVHT